MNALRNLLEGIGAKGKAGREDLCGASHISRCRQFSNSERPTSDFAKYIKTCEEKLTG